MSATVVRTTQTSATCRHGHEWQRGRRPRTAALQRSREQANRAWLAGYKLALGCADCGSRENLEFDHRNPATKSLTIGKRACFSRAKLLREIAKCDVRCRPCHMKRPNHGRVTRR